MKKILASGGPIVFAMWHGHELAMIAFSKHYKLGTITSQSKDGEIMDYVLRRMGFQTARGSSSKGAVSALKGILRISRSGSIPVVPVDGPRGPIYEPKPGVFEVSKFLNAPIAPGGVACGPAIHFKKSWNKAFLPLPFSRVVLHWGELIDPVSSNEDPRSPELAAKLKQALDASSQQAIEFL